MSEIRITIDGKEAIGQAGESILTIARNNGIDIPALCYEDGLSVYGACSLCVVEAENSPKLMRACATIPQDGMIIHTDSMRVKRSRKVAMELLMSDHEGDCLGPCKLECPAGTNCQAYVKQIALGNDKEAVRIIKEHLPLPASIGRVCPHPCETACRRGLVEEPISIAFLKYFAADNDLASGDKFVPEIEPDTGKKVAIVGGGPAGLTAAYFLRKKGHDVTIYDAMPKMGGMLRYGIPEYRLPKTVVDAEVASIEEMGVAMKNNVKIGKDISFEDLQKDNDAVLIAIGAWTSSSIRCKGEDLPGVYGGIDFLREVALGGKPDIGKNVAIVGGGNTAMDACRTAVRLGAEHVYVIYRRTEAEMPAEEIEIAEAKEEGVEFKFLTNPDEIIAENGRVNKVKLQVMELGEPDASGRRRPVPVEGKFEMLEVDSVISAIGQKVDPEGFDVELNQRGIIAADEATFRTSVPGVYAVGDATNKGAGIAIAAIGEANKAAAVIDSYLNGCEIPYRKPYVSKRELTEDDFRDEERSPRAKMPVRPAEERRNDFKEINLGFPEEVARKEAARCLECGCHDYEDCKLIHYANVIDGTDGICPERIKGEKHPNFKETELVSIERNQGKCILCGICTRTCDEEVGKGILSQLERGFKTVINPVYIDSAELAGCPDCNKCASACPTGALKILSGKNFDPTRYGS